MYRHQPLLLFSGGVDSYIAWHFTGKPQTIYFPIQHRYQELELKIVKTLIPNTIIDNSLYLGDQEQDDAFIPMRNLYFAMMASKYSDTLYLGGLLEDRVEDNTDESFEDFERIIKTYGRRDIEIKSPFRDMMKWEIIEWYINNNLPMDPLMQTMSCYSENQYSCGQCSACFRKWIAFKKCDIDIGFGNYELMLSYYMKACDGDYHPKRNHLIIEQCGQILRENHSN